MGEAAKRPGQKRHEWKTGYRRIGQNAAALLAGLLLALPGAGALQGAAVCYAQEGGETAAEADGDAQELKLYAQSAVLMDADTGRVLYGKEADVRRPMASTTKIMTCILALEEGNEEDWVSVSSYAASMPDVQLNIREGEEYRLGDLLYSLMLESHNDTAVAVAEHIGGSVEGFAAMMNQKARDIGCTDTCFVTPNGLDGTRKEDGEIHSTTAADLARIMRYCVELSPKREAFLSITRTASRTIQDKEGKRSFYLANHNALLNMMPEALSGKTGFTGGAGYCYISALKKDGRRFIVALLGCGWPPHKTYKWEDMKKLCRYAFETYDYYEVFDRDKTFPPLLVVDGRQETAPLSLNLREEQETLKLLLKEGEQPDIRYEYAKEKKAPVEAGSVVGSASYYMDGERIASFPIYVTESVEAADYLWHLGQIAGRFFLLRRE